MSLVSSVSSITGTQFHQFRLLREPSFVSLVDYRKPVLSVSFRLTVSFRRLQETSFVSFVSFRQFRIVSFRRIEKTQNLSDALVHLYCNSPVLRSLVPMFPSTYFSKYPCPPGRVPVFPGTYAPLKFSIKDAILNQELGFL